jgi:hypothetical protein
VSALTEAEQDALDALHPEEQEREWAAMREDRDQFERRTGVAEAELRETASALAEEQHQHREAERYAARMEAALEHICTVCRMARRIERPGNSALLDLFDVIACLAKVQDLRGLRKAANG